MNRACLAKDINLYEQKQHASSPAYAGQAIRPIKNNFVRMKFKAITIIFLALLLSISCGTKPKKQVQSSRGLHISFVNKESEKKVDIVVEGKLFTSYCWYENVYKPILYPVYTSAGTEITRGFPLNPRDGESTDHRHQVGIWLTYGNVNGLDFWGNGSLGKWGPNSGEIKHLKIEKLSEGDGEASMVTNESWVDSLGKELLSERTEYYFAAKGSTRIIDRITTLTATSNMVTFKDTKEGMFGIRVARQLQLPSKDDIILKDARGDKTTVKAASNSDISGNYRSSDGIIGDSVWSTRAKWMDLHGKIGNEIISLVICDHPKNQSYPTYWHARGYGLFSANPLGAKDFTKGKEELNFTIPAGKFSTFRYRVIVNSGADLTDQEINGYAEDFARKY